MGVINKSRIKVKAFVFHAKIARWTQRHQILWIANVCELYHLNNCGLHLVGELVNNSMDSYESLNRVSVTKLGVPSGKCQRGEFVYLLWNVPIQIFAIYMYIYIYIFFFFLFHNFRGLKWFRNRNWMAPNFKTTTLTHCRLSLFNRLFAWWRHFTTMTRILQSFAFLCKLGLLLFKPHWGCQI